MKCYSVAFIMPLSIFKILPLIFHNFCDFYVQTLPYISKCRKNTLPHTYTKCYKTCIEKYQSFRNSCQIKECLDLNSIENRARVLRVYYPRLTTMARHFCVILQSVHTVAGIWTTGLKDYKAGLTGLTGQATYNESGAKLFNHN